MPAVKPYDLLVLGEEPPGLAAAACAAKAGARIAVLRQAQGGALTSGAFSTGFPNFVWRRLDLQNAGLNLRPASARASLFDGGRTVKTYESARATSAALEDAQLTDGDIWQDFVADMKERAHGAAEINTRLAGGRAVSGAAFAPGLKELRFLTATCASVLDDYFEDDRLKAHIASAALSEFGLGGDEPGSAGALPALFDAAAWPVRPAPAGPSIADALERVCVDARVDFLKGEIKDVNARDEKTRIVDLGPGGVIRTRFVYCPSARAARIAGGRVLRSLSPLDRGEASEAEIQLTLSQPIDAPGGDRNALYYVANSMAEFSVARADALEWRAPAAAPISFEYMDGGGIFIRTRYCPSGLAERSGVRQWSEQNRQAFARRIVKRLSVFIDGLERSVRRVQVRVFAPPALEGAARINPPDHRIIAPLLAGDVIGGAVRFTDRLLNRD